MKTKLCERCRLVEIRDWRGRKYCDSCRQEVRRETFRDASKRYQEKHSAAKKRRGHMKDTPAA